MAKLEDRASFIIKTILDEAEEKSREINTVAEKFKADEMEKAENEVLEELYDKIQEEIFEIKVNTTHDVAQREFSSRQQLLLRRDEIANRVFEAVRKRLLAYTTTMQYKENLMNCVRQLRENYPFENSNIMLKTSDYHFSGEIEKIFALKCSILTDSGIQIGGVKLSNQSTGIFVDETLDLKLTDQRPWFYGNSGLSVTSKMEDAR